MTNRTVLDLAEGPVLRDHDRGLDYPFLTVEGAEAAAGLVNLVGFAGTPSKLDAYDAPAPTPQGGRVRGDSVLELARAVHNARRVLNQGLALRPGRMANELARDELDRLTRQGRRLMAA